MKDDAQTIANLVCWLTHAVQSTGPDARATNKRSQLANKLRALKELSRDKSSASALYTDVGIAGLCHYAFAPDDQNLEYSDEAKKCLANALTLEDRCVPLFLKAGGLEQLLDTRCLAECDASAEFLFARILFLVTAKTGAMLKDISQHRIVELAHVIKSWLGRHQAWLKARQVHDCIKVAIALIETLKLCFNLSIFLRETFISVFQGQRELESLILSLLADCLIHPAPQIRLGVPHFVNLLTTVGDKQENHRHISEYATLFDVLDQFVKAKLANGSWNELSISSAQMLPLLTVLSDLYISLHGNSEAQAYYEARLLVPASERNVPLGQSQSASAQVLRLLNEGDPDVREGLGTLLYQVSKSDPSQFVENIGYGHAIGFLTAHGLALSPQDASRRYHGQDINPITGQNVKDEQAQQAQKEFREMTEEEKETEAEKMFVLFQRLKKNGVIDVKDPIQEAVDSGRFQEL